jgi:hypothetical protein
MAALNAARVRDNYRMAARARHRPNPVRYKPRSVASQWSNRLVSEPITIWQPQPGPQEALIECPLPEIFFGGARGGGKTDGMLGDWLQHAGRYKGGAKGMFVRRYFVDLEAVIARSKELFYKLGAIWNENRAMWTFPNGATLRFRHLKDGNAAQHYQGHDYSWICFEELTQWPDDKAFNLMRGAMRSAKGVPPCLRATGNPGGPGHGWVKARFIAPAPAGFTVLIDAKTGEPRVFIPSRLEDNRALVDNDPGYENRLKGVGNDALVKAWREGNWDIVAGGFFDDLWSPRLHVLPPFEVPNTWRLRRSFDWGSAAPASLGIWAISDGSTVYHRTYGELFFPRGSMIRINEWYTVAKDDNGLVIANQGLRLNNATLGDGIARRSAGKSFSGCVADPSIFTEMGGPSTYEQMRRGARAAGHQLVFSKADNTRIPGWQRMRELLNNVVEAPLEKPGLYVFDWCTDFLRTVPVLQRDDKYPDDVDTEAEDHAGDDTRYAVMSTRPAARSQEFLL